MAESVQTDNSKDKKVRSKKMNPSVDLTAMVDLAFLLITFFMLTTTLSKSQSMDLAMPDKSEELTEETETKVSENRTVTLILGDDNKMVWYLGQTTSPLEGPNVETYGKNGIRKVLLSKSKQALARSGDEEKGLIVIIKPSDQSHYRNLVDVLDEMAITKIKTYAIVDMTDDDIEMLENEGLYQSNDNKLVN